MGQVKSLMLLAMRLRFKVFFSFVLDSSAVVFTALVASPLRSLATVVSFTTVFLFSSIVLLGGCVSAKKANQNYYGPREQVYYASFEEVWRSVNLVLQSYPIRISNMDQGIIETDQIRGYRVWTPPHRPNDTSGGLSYRLIMHVIRGHYDGQNAIRVTVLKEKSLQKDFFSEAENQPSDGLEEQSLLYRIGREIQIERALEKVQKQKLKK